MKDFVVNCIVINLLDFFLLFFLILITENIFFVIFEYQNDQGINEY